MFQRKAISVTALLIFLLWIICSARADNIISTGTIWQGEVLIEDTTIVQSGVTLTVEPGTKVKFKHYRGYREPEKRLSMQVFGTLIAEGSAAEPIYFTSDASDPQNGDWSMIRIHDSDNSVLSYCVIEFGQQGLNFWNGSPQITHCAIRWHNWEGLYFESYSEPNITYCHIIENGYNGLAAEQFNNIVMDYCEIERSGTNGFHIDASTAQITRALVHNNLANGLSVDNSGTLRALGVAINDNTACGIGVGEGSNTVEVGNVTFSGNSGDICGSYTAVSTDYTAPESIDIGFTPDMSYALGYIPSDPALDRYMYVYPNDETRHIVRKIGKGLGLTWSLAWDGQYIWTCTLWGTVSKLNPQTGDVLQQFTAPGSQPWGMTYDGSHLWLVDFAEKRISKLDPATGAELATYPTPDPLGGCKGVTWDGTCLCVMGWTSSVIYRMDQQGQLIDTVSLDSGGGGGIAWDGEHFWIPCGGKIFKYDPQGHKKGWIYAASEGTWDMTWDNVSRYLWASQRTNENWQDDKIFALEIFNDDGINVLENGYLVTSDLWIRAVINTEEKGPIDAIWRLGGQDTTSRGDTVIWGHFYASPSDVTWGSENNPDLFVKIWFDVSGRVDVNYFHVSVPDIEVYSDYPYDGSPDEQGITTMSRRYIRQYYENGQCYSEENYEDGNPPAGYWPTGNPAGYYTINDLRIGSIINTVEKGPIDAVWRFGGQDTTARGDEVVWGHFYADPLDVTWGSQDNPDLFVKIWFDVSGRVDVNFFHVSVPDIEVYSDLPDDGTYDQKGTTIMDNRYIRHEYWR